MSKRVPSDRSSGWAAWVFEEKVCPVKASEYAQGWADDVADNGPGGFPGAWDESGWGAWERGLPARRSED